ncbi:MAG: flippase-like domain-containing protein [Clostridia bacterium]|nr:flippase-like domain-containing protein [Clostridia bacterium]
MNNSQGKKPSSKLTAIYIGIIALIITGVAVYIAVQYDAVEVLSTIKNIDPVFVLLGVAMTFLQLYSEAGCLKLLFSVLGKKISFFSAAGYAGTDLLYSNISPAQLAGLPAAGYSMYKDGVDTPSACNVLAIYSMCNRIAVVIVATAAVCVFPLLLNTGSALFITLFIYGAIVNLCIVSVFAIALFTPSFARLMIPGVVRFFSRFKFLHITENTIEKSRKSAEDYISASKIIRSSPLTVVFVLLICIVKRIINFSIVYFAYLAFGLRNESFVFIIAVQSVLAVSSESVPIPGSAGVAENVFTILYSGVFGPRLYIPAMIVTRALNFFALLVVSGAHSLVYSLLGRKENKK